MRLRGVINYAMRVIALVYLLVLIGAIVWYKEAFFEAVFFNPFFGIYGLVVCFYILSRFGLALFARSRPDAGIRPAVAVIMPAFNEEHAIRDSILTILDVDYPKDRLEIVVVNDGSTDNTLHEMDKVAAEHREVTLINFPENQGKRAAMAAGIRETKAEIVVFVDSDSQLERDGIYQLVQGFADPRVGAMAGHADVLNTNESWLTKMQAVRYFVAFRVIKAAESLFGAVTCCSGCFAAYRREAVLPHLEEWEYQKFLGVQTTFGDDRSLTNYVLRKWRVHYEKKAVSRTAVPATFKTFMLQQVRWKRSWCRESLIVSKFIWKKNPIAAISTYLGIILPVVAPLAALRALLWQPWVNNVTEGPLIYLLGIYVMALVYGLYYTMHQKEYDGMWIYGIVFVFFYLAILVWQTYYAIFTARKTTWGTRQVEPAHTKRARSLPQLPPAVRPGLPNPDAVPEGIRGLLSAPNFVPEMGPEIALEAPGPYIVQGPWGKKVVDSLPALPPARQHRDREWR